MLNETKQDITLLKGKIRFELLDEKGNVKQVVEKDNTFMAVGDAHVADQLAAVPNEAKMGWIAIGTGATPLTVSSTELNSEIDRNPLSAGYPEQGAGAADNDVIYKATWASGDGTGAITEAGIFNSSANGTILAGSTFPVINKGASDTLTITWTVTAGQS